MYTHADYLTFYNDKIHIWAVTYFPQYILHKYYYTLINL